MAPLLSKNLKAFDVIHIHDCRSFQGMLTSQFARLKEVPYVFQPHGSYLCTLLDSTAKTLAKAAFDKLFGESLIRHAEKLILVNEVEADEYRRVGIPEEKLKVIPNGINLEEYVNLPVKGLFRKKFSIEENISENSSNNTGKTK